jgi:hypothetical protein
LDTNKQEENTMPKAKTYATCDCGLTMRPKGDCGVREMKAKDGKWYSRISNTDQAPFCHDCNAGLGKVHHWGCDSEKCPVCGFQLMGGDCDNQCFPVDLQIRVWKHPSTKFNLN